MTTVIEQPTIENLFPAAVRMTMFIHNTKTDLVVVGGSSAQNAAYMVKLIWQKMYPQEKMPRFVATGMVLRKKKVAVIKDGKKSYFDSSEFNSVLEERAKQEGAKVVPFSKPIKVVNTSLYSKEEIQSMLKERIKKVEPNHNVFLLEEYASRGDTISVLSKTLSGLGYNKVKIGVLALDSRMSSSLLENLKVNFVGERVANTPLNFYGERRRQIQELINYRNYPKDIDSQRIKKFYTKQHLDALKNTRKRIRDAVRK